MEPNEHERHVVDDEFQHAIRCCRCCRRHVGFEGDPERDDPHQWVDASLGPETDPTLQQETEQGRNHDEGRVPRRYREEHSGRNGKQDQDHPIGPKYRRTANSRNHQELACLDKVEPGRGEECYDPGNIDREKNGHEDSDPQARRAIPQQNGHRQRVSDVARAVACPRRPQSRGGPDRRSTAGGGHSHDPAGAEFGQARRHPRETSRPLDVEPRRWKRREVERLRGIPSCKKPHIASCGDVARVV